MMNESQFSIHFVLAILAAWRITHLLANEDGPADLIVKLRATLGDSLAGKLMDCFNCLSLWIAAPAALFVTRAPLLWLFVWLAISGAACLLESAVQQLPEAHTPQTRTEVQPYTQASSWMHTSEGDVSHVLRSEATGSAERSTLRKDPHFSAAVDAARRHEQALDGAYRE
jgi:Protein of unknown function (DUF1360)